MGSSREALTGEERDEVRTAPTKGGGDGRQSIRSLKGTPHHGDGPGWAKDPTGPVCRGQ